MSAGANIEKRETKSTHIHLCKNTTFSRCSCTPQGGYLVGQFVGRDHRGNKLRVAHLYHHLGCIGSIVLSMRFWEDFKQELRSLGFLPMNRARARKQVEGHLAVCNRIPQNTNEKDTHVRSKTHIKIRHELVRICSLSIRL